MDSSVPAGRGNVGLVTEDVSYNLDNVFLVVMTGRQSLIILVVIEEEPPRHAGC